MYLFQWRSLFEKPERRTGTCPGFPTPQNDPEIQARLLMAHFRQDFGANVTKSEDYSVAGRDFNK